MAAAINGGGRDGETERGREGRAESGGRKIKRKRKEKEG